MQSNGERSGDFQRLKENDLDVDLLVQTSRIAWSELQRFFAAGKVLLVGVGEDLVQVATRIVEDDVDFISELQSADRIGPVSDDQARLFLEAHADVWCVVVRPFVLIQEIEPESV